MALIVYEQHKQNVKTLVSKLKAKKVNRNVIIALVVNSLHESYCNPYTLEGAVNPGPPQGSGPGIGLWQWTANANPPALGDWDGQINKMLTDGGQYIPHNTAWWAPAGLAEPSNNFNNWGDFLANKSNVSATNLTRIFLGNWERPGYAYGAQRYNAAPEDVNEVQKYVSASGGVELPVPQWPFDFPLGFNQQPYEQHTPADGFYDHDANQAYDLQANDGSRAAYTAPCNLTTVYAQYSFATRVLVSTEKLYFADGKTGYLAIDLAHDEDASMYQVGKTFKTGEVMGHLGAAGMATGVHAHMALARFANKPTSVPFIRQGPYSAITGGQVSEIRGGDGQGNVANAVTSPGFPNSWTSEAKEKSLGRVTANNTFSVTEKQKSQMHNNFASHVNIDAFKFVESGSDDDNSGGDDGDDDKPKVRHLKKQTLAVMGIFN